MANTGFGMWRLCVLWLIYATWEVAPQVTERVGCFLDSSHFILTGIIYRHRINMTMDWCLNECIIHKGYVFAGLEAGYACVCGNDRDHTKYGQQRPDSECRQSLCPGNRSQTCGGIGRMDIYRDRDECDVDNGGCNQLCVNSPGAYHCACQMGYGMLDGEKHCTDVNECFDDPDLCSMDNVECINTPGSYHCECKPGYTLIQGSCSDVNECFEDPDLCSMDNFECINAPGSYRCECTPGYSLNQGSCSDIDECSHGDDKCNQNCSNTNGSYLCSCMRGYELVGDELYNCTDKDECVYVNICDQVCTNHPGGYECSCCDGYRPEDGQGANCKDIDECTEGSHQCDQTCINTPGLYQCVCEKGYHLEQDLHTCSDIQDNGLLEQIAGLERRTTGFIVGLAVTIGAFTTCLVILLCVCIRLKRDNKKKQCTSTSLQDSPTVAPCYEDVTNYNPPEGSAHYEGLQEFHLEDSTYQTVTPSVQTS